MKKSLLIILLVFVMVSSSWATMLDLTSPGSDGYINDAYFQQIDPQSTGTGVIQSFVRLGASSGTAEGYNTSYRPLEFDENSSPTFTHDLLLADVPLQTINDVVYREFLLDINQQNRNPYLSLDKLEIYISDTGGNTGYSSGLGTLIYDLDFGVDNWIKLDYSNNAGSGSGDMFAYIPNSLFSGTYVYLYSQFGAEGCCTENDGFEEWAVREEETSPPPIPEPGTFLLLGSGFLGLYRLRNKFRK